MSTEIIDILTVITSFHFMFFKFITHCIFYDKSCE
nr:MAG TPA: hypothetical protein [Caudoviricetes sp.]